VVGKYCRILMLDYDQDTLMTLEQILQDAGFYTTTTRNPGEAKRLLEGNYFDLLILGDHPPLLEAAKILRDVQRGCGACVILSDNFGSQVKEFAGLGVLAVISRLDHAHIVEVMRQHSQSSSQFRPTPLAAHGLDVATAGAGKPRM
jgi:DNA-binding response OmpR family regulator